MDKNNVNFGKEKANAHLKILGLLLKEIRQEKGLSIYALEKANNFEYEWRQFNYLETGKKVELDVLIAYLAGIGYNLRFEETKILHEVFKPKNDN